MNRLGRWALLAILAVWLQPGWAARDVPFLDGRVNDRAGMLSSAAEQQIETVLAALERDEGAQVAVLTIDSLAGDSIEAFSLRVVDTWKLGRDQVDDGALLLLVRDDRKMRLEVGYGLEGAIPDLTGRRILDEVMRPRFRRGDFDGGVMQAVETIAGLVRGELALPEPQAGSGRGADIPPNLIWAVLWLVFGVFRARHGAVMWIAGAALVVFSGFTWGLRGGLIALGAVGLATLFRWGYRKTAPRRDDGSPRLGRWSTGGIGGGYSGSGRGGGFSGGGFSGGGGGFGGGGASSSW